MGEQRMKKKIHPKYVEATVTCGCGETWKTRSTREKIVVGICSKCHPFFTGKQKFVDTAGQVEKFQKKFRWSDDRAKNMESEGLDKSRKHVMSHKKMIGEHRRSKEEAKARFRKASQTVADAVKGEGKEKTKGKPPKKAEESAPAASPGKKKQ
jgi:large subunit ribosomal protein L31